MRKKIKKGGKKSSQMKKNLKKTISESVAEAITFYMEGDGVIIDQEYEITVEASTEISVIGKYPEYKLILERVEQNSPQYEEEWINQIDKDDLIRI